MTDLLREAIADAKAVREVALANAKFGRPIPICFKPKFNSFKISSITLLQFL